VLIASTKKTIAGMDKIPKKGSKGDKNTLGNKQANPNPIMSDCFPRSLSVSGEDLQKSRQDRTG